MNTKHLLHQWLWKWHFIAGLVSLPIIILLSITGIVYLFKSDYEKPMYDSLKEVPAEPHLVSYQEQWEIAKKNAIKPPNAMIITADQNKATEFISGRFSGKSSLFISPVDGSVNGEVVTKNTDMYLIRKLHGELLLSKYGTKVVELVASWMVVLILTGLYIWWPKDGWKLKGVFTIRTDGSKRLLYRDIHAVTGFWFSILLLLVLAGGLPWTDVFGSNFKWVQDQTNTGFPKTWDGRAFTSEIKGEPLTLDQMAMIARELDLPGEISLHLPLSPKAVFSVSNRTSELSSMRKLHFDQYSGKPVAKLAWSDIGIMMQGRLWVMAFHQGEFGPWNWYLMLVVAFMLLVMSISGLYTYLLRKRKGEWSVPVVPAQFSVGVGLFIIIIALGIMLPLFALSVALIFAYEQSKLILSS
ncbi:PepSY-associated TM helix domain-containing protein [Reichenbachiella versicolor]|uniref:PepSY-associated TM helix domain-containing protein n=1 Tax=Reichenbachiella versicolor TaxID=1821036 RepID=UPI000D6DDA2D|nr:PepSY domain-containing protein [Reichenbachiella versicolor]